MAVLGYHVEASARHADRLLRADSGFTHRQTLAGVVRFNSPELHEEGESRRGKPAPAPSPQRPSHARGTEQIALIARAPPKSPQPRKPSRASMLPWSHALPALRRAAGAGPSSPMNRLKSRRAATPSSNGHLAPPASFVANDSAWAPRPAAADHRPQHGRQVDLPAPGRADRRAGAGRQLRTRQRASSASSTACSAASAPPTTCARPLHLHGRDGRDRRHPDPGHAARAGGPGRDRPRHAPTTAWRSPGVVEALHDESTAAAPSSPPIITS